MTALQENDERLAEYLNTGRELVISDGALSAKVKTLMTMLDGRIARPGYRR